MPGISRMGDMTAGHGFNPTPSIMGSPDTIVNGIGVLRLGDPFVVHVLGNAAHAPVAAMGSATVLANGLSVMRIGDTTNCGDSMAMGSADAVAGG